MNDRILEIQKYYPRIYTACHVGHQKKRSKTGQISSRDAAILAHLELREFRSPKMLARHLNISPSTLSEALHDLVALGYVHFKQLAQDGRKVEFGLTQAGDAAIAENSVLDGVKIAKLLANLNETDQLKAIEGLKILADAASINNID